MNYEITCQLCKHLLTSPVILNCCSTSVCSDCLSNISYKKDSNNNNSSGKLYYNCPFCFKDSEETETATSNDFLTSFIQYKHMKDKALQSVCERCEKETKYDEIIICNECNNKNLCQECSDTIHSVGRFRVHERTSLTNGVMHQLNCINDLMRCETHIKEKIEHICLKDQQFMCGLCVPSHKQNCKNSVVTIREAYKDLLHQVKLKSEKLKGSLLSLKNDNETLKKTFEKMLESCEKSKNTIQEQFSQLFQALEQKQKEIEFSLEYISVQKKMETNKEIKEIENSCLWVENLIDMTEFAASYQNSSFVPGTKYLFARIDSLLNNLNAKKPTNSADLNTFSSLQFIDECKAALSKISLFASPTVHHEKSKSKLPTPRVNTPIATPPRSNTPQMNKSARYENSNQSTQSPLSRSKDPMKAQRAAIRANTANKNPLNSSINRFNLTIPDKQETQVISSRIQMNTCVETAPDSPKFSNSQSFASSRCNEGGNEDDDDDIVSNYVKITKKPLRVNGGPSSTLATYLNSLGATTSTLCTEQGINLQSAFVKSAEPKHKRNNLSEVKRSKTLNESREEGNSNSNGFYDVQHLTELQKNPLIKRMFTKIAQTATTIFVAWTHPFNTANLCYQIEYGIGTKVQGVEQFRTVFKGPLHTCIISDLMPKTSYRIRVCPILIKNKENDSDDDSAGKGKKEVIGHWSDIITVTTKEPQAIDMETLGSHAKMAVKNGDKAQIEFDKSGTILATNGYTYGKVAWEVKLQQQAAHSMPDDTNAFIRIGVMSKMMKQSTVFGTMINYGLNAHSSTIYVVLDMENRSLTIQSSNSPNKEVIHNLPDGPLYPAFQNKTNKNTNFSLKLFVQFDMPVK